VSTVKAALTHSTFPEASVITTPLRVCSASRASASAGNPSASRLSPGRGGSGQACVASGASPRVSPGPSGIVIDTHPWVWTYVVADPRQDRRHPDWPRRRIRRQAVPSPVRVGQNVRGRALEPWMALRPIRPSIPSMSGQQGPPVRHTSVQAKPSMARPWRRNFLTLPTMHGPATVGCGRARIPRVRLTQATIRPTVPRRIEHPARARAATRGQPLATRRSGRPGMMIKCDQGILSPGADVLPAGDRDIILPGGFLRCVPR
jgi:hypothetical protein